MNIWGAAALISTAIGAYSSYRGAEARNDAADAQASGAYDQIELVRQMAEIEEVADVESLTALHERATFDYALIDRREESLINAVQFNEAQHIKNTELIQKQGAVLLAQQARKSDKEVSTSRARAAGAGIAVGSGAAAEVAKDIAITGNLELLRTKLQIDSAQQNLDEQIGKSRVDAYVSAQNLVADRDVLGFNLNIATRQKELSAQMRGIEIESKIRGLESGAQAAVSGKSSEALAGFGTALAGITRMSGVERKDISL